MPRPVNVLYPTKEELESGTVVVETEADTDLIFDYLTKLFDSGIKPKHLMWVLIAIPNRSLFGVPDFS